MEEGEWSFCSALLAEDGIVSSNFLHEQNSVSHHGFRSGFPYIRG